MQQVYVGVDIGSLSAKIAAVNEAGEVLFHAYRRTSGRPVETALGLLDELHDMAPSVIVATGSGAELLAHEGRGTKDEGRRTVNEFKAIITAIGQLYPDVRTIFEMGGETSKFIRIEPTDAGSLANGPDAGMEARGRNPPEDQLPVSILASGPLDRLPVSSFQIVEYGINGDCAAGTGSFIDQQASRLHYNVEDIGNLVSCADRCARIAGRCSVFAKSDMIHAQQKGYTPPEVLKGLCIAVARNFKATVVKGRHIVPKVAFVGGLALNGGVVNAVREVFELKDGELIVPKEAAYLGAIGAALLARDSSLVAGRSTPLTRTLSPEGRGIKGEGRVTSDERRATNLPPLSTENVRFLRDRMKPYRFPNQGVVNAYLGVDVGSVSTNFAVIDEVGDLIMEIYTYTRARPIEVVSEGLKEIEAAIGDRINIVGVGTTGSGRELIGELIGADVIKDEITAHKTGALHISEGLLSEPVDTIFEIGGQDSKFIRIENSVVTDFAMNEACAAGTGSFLEEQAEKLGISIKDQFAELALSSDSPIPLGERCTVFMERDVNAHQLKGMKLDDIVAGLAYSVATNYLNRVVRGRKIGDHIFFQGGTAYNDAVAAAFSQILGKTITVPPHNGVIGAIGAALLAKEAGNTKQETRSRKIMFHTSCPDGRTIFPTEKSFAASRILDPTNDFSKGKIMSDRDFMPRASSIGTSIHNQNPVSKFRGFDIGRVNYTIREFNCGACTNNCDIQEFNVEEEKTHWGDKCSSRFRKKARTCNKPIIENLVKLRSELLLRTEAGNPVIGMDAGQETRGSKLETGRSSTIHGAPIDTNLAQPKGCYSSIERPASSFHTSINSRNRASSFDSETIGIPRAMFFYDRFPFWRAYFEALGCKIVVSDETNKVISHDSCELSVAEPCYPIKLVHGHIKNLTEKGVDYVWLPNVISGEGTKDEGRGTRDACPPRTTAAGRLRGPPKSRRMSGRRRERRATSDERRTPIPYLCPWHQTISFIIKAVQAFEPTKLLSPTIQFEHGKKFVTRCMEGTALALGASKRQNRTAVDAAYEAQADFNRRLQQLGAEALKRLASEDAQGVVLIGRPYNIYDTGANLNVPIKLREYYGINVIPMDFMPTDEIDIEDAAGNMFWNYGRKIIAVAKLVSSHPNLHMIYITNFKCGPDSFIKHYTSRCAHKPYLTLQFDEHANDAGTLTRIEAYLESKGLLKPRNSFSVIDAGPDTGGGRQEA